MIPYINVPFAYLASLTGASVDELKLLFIFLLSYPLSGLLKRIPDSKPWQKNIYSITISMVYLVGILDLWSGFWNLVFGAIAAYTIAATIVDPIMPWVGFAVLMGHMSVSHLYRQSVNQIGVIDITGAQMVLVMKLTAFCWNVHDGRMKDEDLTDFQRERAIRQLPGLLDYAGFVLFFPSLMAGPAFDYVDYAKYITTSMFDLPPGTDPAKAPPTRKKRRIPRSGTPAMLKMATGLIWVLAFLLLAGKINNDFMLSDEFLSYGIFTRIFWLYLFGFTTRTKYYGVWNLTEGSCILAGIGYAGIDSQTGRANWDRLVNIKPFGVEFAQNTRAYLGSWNINTNNWLRNYIYLRVTPKGKKPGFRSTLATFLTSAFWHGFYPGYYLTFVMGALLQNIAQNCRRYIRPFFLTPEGKPLPTKKYYDIASWLLTQTFFSFTTAPFGLLTMRISLTVWSRVYFFGIIGAAAGMGLFASPAKPWLASHVKARTERPGVVRMKSEGGDAVMLGVPMDAETELNQLVEEVKAEIERRKAQGLNVPDVRALVKEKLGNVNLPGIDKEKIKKEL